MVRPLAISAPGSLMLLGEHAVLHGHPCLVTAINKRVRISIMPRNDGMVTIASALGDYEGERDALPDHPSFRFVIGALRQLSLACPGGLDMAISADMPPTIGFGTSAAVTAAMVGALHLTMHGSLALPSLLVDARSIIQQVQGRGSGADAAASIYGGIVQYQINAEIPAIIPCEPHAVTAVYCGYKTPTPEVIAKVSEAWASRNQDLQRLYAQIGETVTRGATSLSNGQHGDFGRVLNEGHDLMKELGVTTPELEQCVEKLRRSQSIIGAKISGSGLGDCAIGWGHATVSFSPFEHYAIMTEREGIRLE